MMDKTWMEVNNRATLDYVEGVDKFLEFAFGQPGVNDRIRFPCNRCRNTSYRPRREVKAHLFKKGIVKSYKIWVFHGEKLAETLQSFVNVDRTKLIAKDTCGTKFYVEVQEMIRDSITGEEAPPNEVWIKQRTKMSEKGELDLLDPKSKEIHEQLQELVNQQTQEQEGELQMTRDEILFQVLGEKSRYFRRKEAGKKVPSKRTRKFEDVHFQVQRAMDQAKEAMMGEFTVTKLEKVRKEVRDEVHAEQCIEALREKMKAEIRAKIQQELDTMIQERIATFFGSMSQSMG